MINLCDMYVVLAPGVTSAVEAVKVLQGRGQLGVAEVARCFGVAEAVMCAELEGIKDMLQDVARVVQVSKAYMVMRDGGWGSSSKRPPHYCSAALTTRSGSRPSQAPIGFPCFAPTLHILPLSF